MSKLLSVIIPAFNEEQMVQEASKRIRSVLNSADIPAEIIFIDDGSTDNTWGLIQKEANEFPEIKGIKFSRNFGKEAAISAGLEQSTGACSVVIDCDLQHPPEKIVEMYRLWEQGYEIIEAKKSSRGKESYARRVCANAFYRIISKTTKIDMRNASDFKLLDRKAVLAILNMKEKNSFFRALSSWVGFKTTEISFDVQERTAGASKWSSFGLVKYAISNITSFSTFPMQLTTILGIITFIISIVMGMISLVQKIMGQSLEGFTTVILLQLLFSSIIMFCLGIIGYYISKIYEEIKERPKFIISEKCNGNKDE
jgi:dolichol-phosphate mannosyltransferase